MKETSLTRSTLSVLVIASYSVWTISAAIWIYHADVIHVHVQLLVIGSALVYCLYAGRLFVYWMDWPNDSFMMTFVKIICAIVLSPLAILLATSLNRSRHFATWWSRVMSGSKLKWSDGLLNSKPGGLYDIHCLHLFVTWIILNTARHLLEPTVQESTNTLLLITTGCFSIQTAVCILFDFENMFSTSDCMWLACAGALDVIRTLLRWYTLIDVFFFSDGDRSVVLSALLRTPVWLHFGSLIFTSCCMGVAAVYLEMAYRPQAPRYRHLMGMCKNAPAIAVLLMLSDFAPHVLVALVTLTICYPYLDQSKHIGSIDADVFLLSSSQKLFSDEFDKKLRMWILNRYHARRYLLFRSCTRNADLIRNHQEGKLFDSLPQSRLSVGVLSDDTRSQITNVTANTEYMDDEWCITPRFPVSVQRAVPSAQLSKQNWYSGAAHAILTMPFQQFRADLHIHAVNCWSDDYPRSITSDQLGTLTLWQRCWLYEGRVDFIDTPSAPFAPVKPGTPNANMSLYHFMLRTTGLIWIGCLYPLSWICTLAQELILGMLSDTKYCIWVGWCLLFVLFFVYLWLFRRVIDEQSNKSSVIHYPTAELADSFDVNAFNKRTRRTLVHVQEQYAQVCRRQVAACCLGRADDPNMCEKSRFTPLVVLPMELRQLILSFLPTGDHVPHYIDTEADLQQDIDAIHTHLVYNEPPPLPQTYPGNRVIHKLIHLLKEHHMSWSELVQRHLPAIAKRGVYYSLEQGWLESESTDITIQPQTPYYPQSYM